MKNINKDLTIRPSGRSSDFLAPDFAKGCHFNCSYCTCKRYRNDLPVFFTNTEEILHAIAKHADSNMLFRLVTKPNQTHEKYITYDISVKEDFALHRKFHDWKRIFKFFRDHPHAFGTLATKAIPWDFLDFNPNKKVRIRFSLMPQVISSVLEPNTPKIIDRIKAVNEFVNSGYDVDLNFSPVVVYNGWKHDYRKLFELVDYHVKDKSHVNCEVIFLTHNKIKHDYNIKNKLQGEVEYLWKPEWQESKVSQYGGTNLRYKRDLKRRGIQSFKDLHKEIIEWCTIRYIF